MDPDNTSNKGADDNGSGQKVALKREMGLLSGVAIIMGTMIGSGIFISPKGMFEGCGSVGLTLLTWGLCGLLVTLSALVYAELGTMIPESGGEHAYIMYTFNKDRSKRGVVKAKSGSSGRFPAFIYDWVALFVIRPTMFAIISLALGTYAAKPFYPDCDPPPMVVKLITIVAMCLMGFINVYSVKMATNVQIVTMFTKLVALAIISIGGLVMIFKGHTENLSEGFEDTSTNAASAAIAFYNGLWAFDGWNGLNFVTEELKNPSKNLPRAILLGIPLTTVCYVFANIGYLAVMSKEEIMLSHAVAVTWGDRMLGVMSWMIPMFVIASTFGASNGSLFSSARLCYSAGRDGHFPKVFSFVSIDRLTPMPSIMFTVLVAMCLIIPGDLSTLIDFFSFSSWFFYGLTTACLLILRYKEPDAVRPFKVPIFIPIIVLGACIYLVIAPILQNPGMQFVYAALFFVIGLIVYIPFIHLNFQIFFMDSLTILLQKLFRIAPPGK